MGSPCPYPVKKQKIERDWACIQQPHWRNGKRILSDRFSENLWSLRLKVSKRSILWLSCNDWKTMSAQLAKFQMSTPTNTSHCSLIGNHWAKMVSFHGTFSLKAATKGLGKWWTILIGLITCLQWPRSSKCRVGETNPVIWQARLWDFKASCHEPNPHSKPPQNPPFCQTTDLTSSFAKSTAEIITMQRTTILYSVQSVRLSKGNRNPSWFSNH